MAGKDAIQIASLKKAIANLTEKIADTNFSWTSIQCMVRIREKHYTALKMLEKHNK